MDTTAPAVTVSTELPSPANAAGIPVTVTFSEKVTGFTADGLAVSNGVAGAVTPADGQVYFVSITPSADGTVAVSVAANAARDTAGNGNLPASSLTLMYDTTEPMPGGAITVGTCTYTAISLTWPAASDTVTAQTKLQYAVICSTADIATVADALSKEPAAGWTTNMTSAAVAGLKEGTLFHFTVLVKDEAGNVAMYDEISRQTNRIPEQAASGPGTGREEGQPLTETPVMTTNAEGQTVTTVMVDMEKLGDFLDSAETGAVVLIPVTGATDVAVGVLNGEMVRAMADKSAVFTIQTDSVSYMLPASGINIDAIAAQFGTDVSLMDIAVTVEISGPTAETVAAAESAAKTAGCRIVIPAMSFTVCCTCNGKTVIADKFSDYVRRTIALPNGVGPKEITTCVVVEADGTIRHVPTTVTLENGKFYAVINSMTNSTYAGVWHSVKFTDTADHWARGAIDDLSSRMVVGGIGNNRFEPDRGMTRAEFAALIIRALGLAPGSGESGYCDVSASDWYCGCLKTAADYGIIAGYGDGSFGPDDLITREQAAAVLARVMMLTGIEAAFPVDAVTAMLSAFTDGAFVAAYAEEGTAACIGAGIVSGRPDGRLAPRENITRAEAAVMVQRLLQKSGLI